MSFTRFFVVAGVIYAAYSISLVVIGLVSGIDYLVPFGIIGGMAIISLTAVFALISHSRAKRGLIPGFTS